MYANYAVWGGWSGGPDDDFFPVGVGSVQLEGAIWGVGKSDNAM